MINKHAAVPLCIVLPYVITIRRCPEPDTMSDSRNRVEKGRGIRGREGGSEGREGDSEGREGG